MDKIERRRAIEGARQDINALIAIGFLKHGEKWIRAWYTYDLKWSEGDDGHLTLPKRNLGPFIEHALRCPKVFELLMFFSGTRLSANVPIPSEVRAVVAEHLKGRLPKPSGEKGRSTTWGRDFIIINSMHRLLDSYDMSTMANRVPLGVRDRKVNASEIIKEAAEGTDIGYVTTDLIQKIWGSKRKQKDHDEAYGLYLSSLLDDEPELERV